MAGKGFREGEVLCWKFSISMERLFLLRGAAEWLSFYFPSWWDKDWKIMSKKHVTGIFPGKKG